jgi:hypothetical protein
MSTNKDNLDRRRSAGHGRDQGQSQPYEEETGSTTPVGSRTGLDRREADSEAGGHGSRRKQAWYIRWIKGWGSGMRNDIVHRLPYYASDWTDAWNYRVVPATWVSQVCCSCLGQAPAISDMADSDSSLSSSPTSFLESRSPWT